MNYTGYSLCDADNLSAITSNLQKCRQIGKDKFIACCPVHNDKTPSLAITKKTDGVILLHCFGCGAGGVDICDALGINPSSLFPSTNNPRYQKQSRSGFSAWQMLDALRGDLTRLLIIANDLKKLNVLADDDRQFIGEVILRVNDGLSYLEGAR